MKKAFYVDEDVFGDVYQYGDDVDGYFEPAHRVTQIRVFTDEHQFFGRAVVVDERNSSTDMAGIMDKSFDYAISPKDRSDYASIFREFLSDELGTKVLGYSPDVAIHSDWTGNFCT